jgi:uncharacterized membrane-anchored protein YjiN (DUF445 family)
MDKGDLLEDVEQIVLYQVAQKVIEVLPEEERRKVLVASLTKTLDDILRPWDVQKAIEKDVNRYMMEYLGKPEIQDRIKIATERTVDKLMNGVIEVIISSSQDAIKSNYKNFMVKKEMP